MSNQAYDIIAADVWGAEAAFNDLSSDRSLNFRAEAEFAIQSLMASDFAMGVAQRNRTSVVNAVQNIAAIGISLNPAKKQAYLVPRDGKICLDISYMGLMDLAMQSGSIRWAQCALVHQADAFALNGLDKQPDHKFNPFAKDRGPIVGVYAVVKTNDGDYLTHPMAIDDVYAVRDKSQAWLAFLNKKTKSCIWQDHEGEMVKKTCIKQAYKYWPKGERSGKLEAAIHYMNDQAGEGIQKDDPPRTAGGAISATCGAMESMTREDQDYLREMAHDLKELFAVNGAAATFDRVRADELDNDKTVALWSLLPSDIRSALKREGKARAEAAASAGSP